MASRLHNPLVSDLIVELPCGRYMLRRKINEISFPEWGDDDRKMPVLIFGSTEHEITEAYLTEQVQHFQATDDVFSSDFLSSIIVVQSKDPSLIRKIRSMSIILKQSPISWDVQKILPLPTMPEKPLLPSGPYFLWRGQIFEAWKLYDDPLSSFQTTVLPYLDDPYQFGILDAASADGFWKAVAVPSRLYKRPSAEFPLAGSRIAVKDLFHLSGIKSALNVRAFLESHGPDEFTAEYVRKLIDLGATIVGKTKMTAFAGGERAPEFWIDFHCPFNPRADGYQTPSGSTSGGGACLAGYPWLDYSLGSDTYGSIRWPAAANGVYGLRCTVDEAASMEGVYAQVPLFDTLGLMSRDLVGLHYLARVSLNPGVSQELEFPKKILCPTDWSSTHSPFHNAVAEKLASALEELLGVSRIEISLAEMWQKHPPDEAEGKSFQQFFNKTGYNIFYHDAYHEWDHFRADYQERFGKKPYVGPHVTYLWGLGKEITAEDRSSAVKELEIYRRWIANYIFPTEKGSEESAVIVLPVLSTKPDYRDVLSGPFTARLGVDEITFGSWLGIPELVLPIDQIAYHSKITDRSEHLPVSVSILGAKGSDLMLIDLALKALEKSGIPTSIETGRTMFPSAEELQHQ